MSQLRRIATVAPLFLVIAALACSNAPADRSDEAASPATVAAAAPVTPAVTPVTPATRVTPGSNATVPTVVVYKSPTCGCCKAWVAHLQDNGFAVEVHDVNDVDPVRRAHGVAPDLAACHTALIDGYVVEGHVPADLIAKLITERPHIAGLAVPGMPEGAPGMETGTKEPYDVIAFDSTGHTSVYAHR